MTRSDQPKSPAVAIVRQNGLSSASCRSSVAVTPVSRQIWWIQVVGGRPLARLHSCEGRSPSLVLVQIRRIWFACTSLRSLATWPNRPSLRLRTMYETSNRPVRLRTSSLDTKSCQLMCKIRCMSADCVTDWRMKFECFCVCYVSGVTCQWSCWCRSISPLSRLVSILMDHSVSGLVLWYIGPAGVHCTYYYWSSAELCAFSGTPCGVLCHKLVRCM